MGGWEKGDGGVKKFKEVKSHMSLRDGRIGDVDNYAKSILDGLNGVAWEDDRQVVELHIYRHTERPQRAEVRIQELSQVAD